MFLNFVFFFRLHSFSSLSRRSFDTTAHFVRLILTPYNRYPPKHTPIFFINFLYNLSKLTCTFPIILLTVIALELRAAFGLLIDDHTSVRWWVRHFRTHSQVAHQVTGRARAPQARLVCVDRRARFVAPTLVTASGRRDV